MRHLVGHLDLASAFRLQLSLNLEHLRVIQLHEASPQFNSSFGDSIFCVFAFAFRKYANIFFLHQSNLIIYQDCNYLVYLLRDQLNLICV
jgi:hypothetical protein